MKTNNLPEIQYRTNKKAKYLRITIKRENIIVTIPKGVSQKRAEKFVIAKKDWLKKQLIKKDACQKYTKQNSSEIVITNLKNTKAHLRNNFSEIAQKHKFEFNRIFIRIQKTRWGSCSMKNNINLNLKILTLPDELQNYIFIHELVHTKIKNHQKEFWDEMQKYFTEPKKIAKKLRKYNLADCKISFASNEK